MRCAAVSLISGARIHAGVRDTVERAGRVFALVVPILERWFAGRTAAWRACLVADRGVLATRHRVDRTYEECPVQSLSRIGCLTGWSSYRPTTSVPRAAGAMTRSSLGLSRMQTRRNPVFRSCASCTT